MTVRPCCFLGEQATCCSWTTCCQHMAVNRLRDIVPFLWQWGIRLPERICNEGVFAMEQIDGYRLSPLQKNLLFIQERHHVVDVFLADCAILIEGELRECLLKDALNNVVMRSEVLRTSFRKPRGMSLPLQVICPPRIAWGQTRDLSAWEAERKNAEIGSLLEKPFARSHQPQTDLVLSASLWKLDEFLHVLELHLPALWSDAPGLSNLMKDLAASYAPISHGSPADAGRIQYADAAEVLNEMLECDETASGRTFWRRRAPEDRDIVLHVDRSVRQQVGPFSPRVCSAELTDLQAKAVQSHALSLGTSEDSVLLCCWLELLRRLCGDSSIVAWVLFNGRTHPRLEHAIGLFSRYLPIEWRCEPGADFGCAIKKLSQELRELATWQHYYNPGERGVLSSCFEFEDESERCEGSGAEFSILRKFVCLDAFRIKLRAVRRQRRLFLEMHWDDSIYGAADAAHLLSLYTGLLESALTKRGIPFNDLPWLNPEDCAKLIAQSNGESVTRDAMVPVHVLFERQAKQTPGQVAVVYEGRELSYEELNRRANQVGHYLRGLGVGAEERVGICVERSLEMVVGLLGILKAGGAYVPLDPEYPPERLGYMLEDARVPVLLTQERIRERLPESDARIVELDKEWEQIARESSEDLPSVTEGENAAYVMYTSGSTGRPKGVVVTHGGLTNYLLWGAGNYAMEGRAGAPIHSSISFDLTITSLYVPLIRGDHIILFGNKKNIEEVTDTLAASRDLGLLKVTPSHLEALTLHGAGAFRGVVQVLIIGGEALSQQQLMKWREECPETRLINEYGPTETVVGCCSYEVAERDALSG